MLPRKEKCSPTNPSKSIVRIVNFYSIVKAPNYVVASWWLSSGKYNPNPTATGFGALSISWQLQCGSTCQKMTVYNNDSPAKQILGLDRGGRQSNIFVQFKCFWEVRTAINLIGGWSSMICASGTFEVALRKWANGCPKVWGNARAITCALDESAVVVESPYSTLTVVPCFKRSC